jgi:hypothetical protein
MTTWYNIENDVYYIDCNVNYTEMPTVSFLIQGYFFDVPPQSYILKEREDVCKLSFIT